MITVFDKAVEYVLISPWLPEEIKQLVIQEMHYERTKKLNDLESKYGLSYQSDFGEAIATEENDPRANVNWLFAWDCTRDERFFNAVSDAMTTRMPFRMLEGYYIKVILDPVLTVVKDTPIWDNYIQEES